ncbi:MAG: hypothetical protein Ta2A_15660 [Treponemataceae bacterium]|nr:MAG: hypothetical protein Ta2A_15660 [Treponemataceae bacterium]
MKKNHGLLLGSAALLTAALFTMASCARLEVPSPAYVVADRTSPDIKAKFGVSTAKEAFAKLHLLISSPKGTDDFTKIIALGDYIDLPALTIDGITITDAAITPGTPPFDGYDGRLLRLIVVGINSFNGKNDNNTPHVVFQFQNVPGTHRMNPNNNTEGGYKDSEMRAYLTGNFLAGLKAAGGLTDAMLWAPKRKVWNGFLQSESGSSANTAVDTIKDMLFLPTDWEMFGINDASASLYETDANQARLDYYATGDAGNASRAKYNSANTAVMYGLASPHFTQKGYFCSVGGAGTNLGDSGSGNSSSSTRGCAPAFCVK